MRLDRVLRNTAGTIRVTFTLDGVATDPTPDDASVTLTRDSDGTTLGPYDAYDEGEGEFSHTLTPTETADLDGLTAEWTVSFDSYTQVLTTRVEVVGGFLFSLADLSAVRTGASGTVGATSTAARMAVMRTLVECALEDACAVAFVPRYRRETLQGDGGYTVMLDRPYIQAIRSVTVDGVETTHTGVTPSGALSFGSRVSGQVVVHYEHGHPHAPPRMTHAGLLLAKRWLVEGPADDRATSMSTDAGTFALVTPGMRGALFDIPTVNAAVMQYDVTALVA